MTILPARRLSANDPWVCHEVPWLILGVIGEDTWYTATCEWIVYSVLSNETMFYELYSLKHLYYSLYCNGMQTEPVTGNDFALLNGSDADVYIL